MIMKSILLIEILALCCLGCNDFLEEKSQSEVRPSTVTDMEKILLGEAYFKQETGNLYNENTDLFTDNMQCNDVSESLQNIMLTNMKNQERYRFCWDKAMFDENGGGEDVSFWYEPYEGIKGCNLVLEYIDRMTGKKDKREHIRGEAYTLRGYYYLMLVNFFGLPWQYGEPAVNPAVPLKLTCGVTDEKMARNSVAEVYRQIEKDLLLGAKLLKENELTTDFVRVNYLAAYALLARMYLYKEDWDNALKYTDLVLAERAELLSLQSLGSSPYNLGGVYARNTPAEIIWGCLKMRNYNAGLVYPFTLSDDFLNVYDEDVDGETQDLRFSTWLGSYVKKMSETLMDNDYHVVGENIGYVIDKCNNSIENYDGGIRTAELYLNRAEIYARKYLKSGNMEYAVAALQDLNELRRNRFTDGYIEKNLSDFSGAQELLAFCLRERRRELSGEANHRWFDLRRLGMPEIEHIYFYKKGEEQTFKLEQNDKRYSLPIPVKVRERNPALEQN